MKALGLIELLGYCPAVVALDTALKTAEVSFQQISKIDKGIVSLTVTGDVAAVQAAMDAAAAVMLVTFKSRATVRNSFTVMPSSTSKVRLSAKAFKSAGVFADFWYRRRQSREKCIWQPQCVQCY